MRQSYEYNWPIPVVNGISLFQVLEANTPLMLNGSYVNKTTKTANFVDDFDIVPRITLSSEDDLSGINFLITGYQNGVFISETLTGPNSTTVTSVNCFDTLMQIIPSGTIDSTLQVGVASVGYFPIILLNTAKIDNASMNYALNIVTPVLKPVTYRIFLSLKNNLGMGKYDDLTSNTNRNFVATKRLASNTSELIQYNALASNLLIKIGPNINGSQLKAQFLQL